MSRLILSEPGSEDPIYGFELSRMALLALFADAGFDVSALMDRADMTQEELDFVTDTPKKFIEEKKKVLLETISSSKAKQKEGFLNDMDKWERKRFGLAAHLAEAKIKILEAVERNALQPARKKSYA